MNNGCNQQRNNLSSFKSKGYPSRRAEQNNMVELQILDQVQPTAEIFTTNDQTSTQSIMYSKNKHYVNVNINNYNMQFRHDTGATCSVVGLKGYNQLGRPRCTKGNKILKVYGGIQIPVKGSVMVDVKYGNQTRKLELIITTMRFGENIFGMDWMKSFSNDPSADNQLNTMVSTDPIKSTPDTKTIEAICTKHALLFQSDMGKCSSYKASLHLKANAVPKFYKPRPIPFAQINGVKKEIDRLVSEGILKPIKISEWAAPIVVVSKPDGRVRICGDFKVTVNPQINIEQYPIPRAEELFQKLKHGKMFSKIDLADAYLQIELEESSKKLLVINTPHGLFEYQRLPFGIASAPAIFQRLIEQIIANVPGCANYLDDIVVTGSSEEEHLQRLDTVFQRLEENGLRCNRSKCMFFAPEIEYLGNIIDSTGIRPSDAGIKAVQLLPRPKNKAELESFIGKVNYYNKFIKGFSHIAGPLNQLRKDGVKFDWKNCQEQAFKQLKNKIVEYTKLVHFSAELPIVLATDASSYGIGAVISHISADGTENPIAYASKTLNEHEKRYSQIEREALSIVFGVNRFHQYLYGRKFLLQTDHKPLVSIFSPSKGLPVMTMQRLQRWAIRLMAYNYEIQFRPTKQHCNADALSRLPVGPDTQFDQCNLSCNNIEASENNIVNNLPITHKRIKDASQKDPVLQQVVRYIEHGWPEVQPDNVQLIPFFQRRLQLSIHEGVIIMQNTHKRVVVPKSLQIKVIQMLHKSHWGIVRMKLLARRYIWWPRIDNDIQTITSQCEICCSNASSPKREFESWPEPQEPWERVHLDFAGPFQESMWLICIDAYSKFPYIVPLSSTTTQATINSLLKIISIEGFPNSIVTDNGPQFTSQFFNEFCQQRGIRHLTTAPFHPASNGEAERFVRTFKTAMRKARMEGRTKLDALTAILSTYRMTPNPANGKSPAELLHGRQPRFELSLMLAAKIPDMRLQKRVSKFSNNQLVFTKNYSGNKIKWIKGSIIKSCGSMMYIVRTELGNWRRHQNQIRLAGNICNNDQAKEKIENNIPFNIALYKDLSTNQENNGNEPEKAKLADQEVDIGKEILPPRRSNRQRQPPVRFVAG